MCCHSVLVFFFGIQFHKNKVQSTGKNANSFPYNYCLKCAQRAEHLILFFLLLAILYVAVFFFYFVFCYELKVFTDADLKFGCINKGRSQSTALRLLCCVWYVFAFYYFKPINVIFSYFILFHFFFFCCCFFYSFTCFFFSTTWYLIRICFDFCVWRN